MARWTVLTRRLGFLFVALMLAIGALGPQAVGASSNANRPPINQPGGNQPPPGICIPCLSGIVDLHEKTLFHASNYPGKSMVDMGFTFVGSPATVAYDVQDASSNAAPNYWNMPLQKSGKYTMDEYLNKGDQYRITVKVVDTYGATYTQELVFWAD